jgi:hypothetical protein
MPAMPRSPAALLPVGLLAALVAVPSAQAAFPGMRNAHVKIQGEMRTTFSSRPTPDCAPDGRPTGPSASGREVIRFRNSKVIKAQIGLLGGRPQVLFKVAGKPVYDLPVSGTIEREGQGDQFACGKALHPDIAKCTGSRRFTGTIVPAFNLRRRFDMNTQRMPMTGDLYPDCEWIYDSHIGRTGAMLLNHVQGSYDPRRFRGRSSFTFRAGDRSDCKGETWDITCDTVSTWKISFYPDKKKPRRR